MLHPAAHPHPALVQSTAGSLNTVRGWMGFLMAIGALVSTVIYYILLQARYCACCTGC